MRKSTIWKITGGVLILNAGYVFPLSAQPAAAPAATNSGEVSIFMIILFILVTSALAGAWYLYRQTKEISKITGKRRNEQQDIRFKEYVNTLNSRQIDRYIKFLKIIHPEATAFPARSGRLPV